MTSCLHAGHALLTVFCNHLFDVTGNTLQTTVSSTSLTTAIVSCITHHHAPTQLSSRTQAPASLLAAVSQFFLENGTK